MFRCTGTSSSAHLLQHFRNLFLLCHALLHPVLQVNQLKGAIQIHNESIQFLKRQNAELREDLEEAKRKVSLELCACRLDLSFLSASHQFEQHQEYYNEMKKQNLELETEVSTAI
jgi:hypothetical protein